MLGVGRKRSHLRPCRPTSVDLDVVVLVCAVGHVGRGKVGDQQKLLAQFLGHGLESLGRQLLVVAQVTALRGEFVGLRAVLVSRASPTWRESSLTSARSRSASWSSRRCSTSSAMISSMVATSTPAPRQGGLHEFGFTAQLSEINHAAKPTEDAQGGLGDRLGSKVVSNAVEVSQPEGRLRRCCVAVDDVSLHVDYGEVVDPARSQRRRQDDGSRDAPGFSTPRRRDASALHGLDPVRDHREVVVRTGALLQRGGVWFPMTPAPGARPHRHLLRGAARARPSCWRCSTWSGARERRGAA